MVVRERTLDRIQRWVVNIESNVEGGAMEADGGLEGGDLRREIALPGRLWEEKVGQRSNGSESQFG